uniref:Putative DNA binding, helix-turn-helix domain containing protein n=2 Tax=viral metagenome TaxID=1070528 RepID=A0A6M3IZZ9_9ZZZZ
MNISEVLALSDKYAAAECRKRSWRVTPDVLQEARIRAWKTWTSKHFTNRSLLHRVVSFAVLDNMRSTYGRTSSTSKTTLLGGRERDIPDSRPSSPQTDSIHSETLDAIHNAMANPYRKIFRLLRKGYDRRNIANHLNLSLNTVYIYVCNTLKVARQLAKELGYDHLP